MQKAIFEISKMDCPSEENLIRMKLDSISGIKKLEFDIPHRKLTVYHLEALSQIEKSLSELQLGEKLLENETTIETAFEEEASQRSLLWTVLAINFGFFLIEMMTGLISGSMGLIADSLDMLADAFVYGISLYAIGTPLTKKKKIATTAGYFQITLAAIGFVEVLRRFLGDERLPDYKMMIYISILALIANAICLYLLQKSRSKNEVHMKATMIFTSNDVIINAGVIVAGLLVLWLKTDLPDLFIGTIVFLIVIQGAIRILKLGR